ncbi:MAG: general secretion pathway protein GspF [Deltaproteobacteria bacterium]|nr:general secretion pathway protein GspF [Deltaproteobacteria bacterium]MBW2417357.1 general secretion pathway protein GspF [Deltaproteobacteria bacterium]
MSRKILDLESIGPMRHEGHRGPVTRRDFLAQGLATGTAAVLSPTLFGLLGRSHDAYAQAVGCGVAPPGGDKIPFVCIDLAGGASVAGSNVLVGGQGGQEDFLSVQGYEKLGLPEEMTPMQSVLPVVNRELGLAFHEDSAFLAGIKNRATPTTLLNTNGAVLCARSLNDTSNNPHNPVYGINKAGANGNLVSLVGMRNSESGGRSLAPEHMIDPAVRPTKIDRPSDVTGLVDTGKLASLLGPQGSNRVMNSITEISDAQLARLNEDTIVEGLISQSYTQSAQLIQTYGNPACLDPLQDPSIVGDLSSIFSMGELTDNGQGARYFAPTASVMKLVVEGHAGAGTLSFGGYDYHDSTRATGETRDFMAGQTMGAMLEFAAKMGRELMIYVFSDGSVASNGQIDTSAEGRNKGIWKGDNSSTASVFFLLYSPTARPALRNASSQQIGHFSSSGSAVSNATAISNAPELLAEAIVLNYLALHHDEDEAVRQFPLVLPNQGLSTVESDLKSLIAFQQMPTTPPTP